MNTPTPRTDAATYPADCLGKTVVTNRDCSRALERELTALTAERDQLRADCENETKWAAHYLAQSIADKSRAEKAERAETVALANWNGALERAMKAEADLAALAQCHDDNCRALVKLDVELTAERARLDAGTILLTVAGERVWHCGVDLRAAIDAAMKEAAK
jgi:hypothetical protein